MGAVVVRRKIYDAFMGGAETPIELFHGYTYSGHPRPAPPGSRRSTSTRRKACSRACGAGALLGGGGAFAEGRPRHRHPQFRAHRGVEFEPRARQADAARALPASRGVQRGLLIRATGDIIALSPPFIIEKNEIDQLIEILSGVLKSVN